MTSAEVRSVVIGTAGHIDHGKSALVKALTGTDPDRLKEEKARGITIDLGFAHAEIDGFDVAFVDVPGHERFVKNMLAGAGGIDAVLLVIAADESVMPQTREHFAICRLLQVRAGLVALTKSDLVDADTLELARLDAHALLAGSALAGAPIVAVSSRTGAGLEALRHALATVAATAPRRAAEGAPRLPIDRVFSMRGFGTVVTGTLTSGTLRAGGDEDLVVLPSGRRVKVRGLQVHGTARAVAGAGRRVAANLGGVDVGEIARGDTLTAADAFDVTRRFDALIELLPDAGPLRHGARVRFHHGTVELLGRVALAAGARDRLATDSTDHVATDNTEDTDGTDQSATEDTAHTDQENSGSGLSDRVATDHTDNTDGTDQSATDHTDHTDQENSGSGLSDRVATDNTEDTDGTDQLATEDTAHTDQENSGSGLSDRVATDNTEDTDGTDQLATEDTAHTDQENSGSGLSDHVAPDNTEDTDGTDQSATEDTEQENSGSGFSDHVARDNTECTGGTGQSTTEDTEHTDRMFGSGLSELRPGRRAYVRVRLEAPAVLTRGDRFILRQYSPAMTIAGGRVLDPSPARTPIRTPAAAARFAQLHGREVAAAIAFVEERRGAGLTAEALARRAGITPAAAAAMCATLVTAGSLVVVGGEAFSAPLVTALEAKLLAAVAEHHRAKPMSDGLPREEARERVFGHASSALFDEVVRRLVAAGQIAGRDRLAQPGRGISLSPEETRALEGLDRVFRAAGLAPPDFAAAAAAVGVTAVVANRVSRLLTRQKTLVKVETLFFHASALDRLKQEVTALKGQGGPARVDVAGFKERYGISRKYAIPLLEWLDRERVTRRTGDTRVIL